MNKRCVVCGFPFESDDSTNVCGDDCREVRRQMMREAYNNRVKAQKKLKVKTCIMCGKEFTGRNCGKCCSVECQDELYKKRQEERRKRNKARREAGYIPKRKAPPVERKTTICWSCQNATGGCSWSRCLKPVKRWKAEKLKLKVSNKYDGKYVTSYVVFECPEYIKDN
jgi:predicted nucleic acid-binding Zn ribbon protein